MIKEYVHSTVLRARLSSGLLAPYVEDFVSWQRGQGFKLSTIQCDLRSLAGWADWMETRGFTQDCNLISGHEKCKAELKSRGRIFYSRGPNKYSIKVAAKYIRFLRERGVLEPLPRKLSVSETWPLLAEFRSWSIEHRGLKTTTLDLYETCLRDLMIELGTDPSVYKAETIRKFILNRAKPHSVWRAQGITVATRSFLRYLSATGQCPISLVGSVPKYHNYEHKGLPRYLETLESDSNDLALHLPAKVCKTSDRPSEARLLRRLVSLMKYCRDTLKAEFENKALGLLMAFRCLGNKAVP